VRSAFDESRGIENNEIERFSTPVPFPKVIKNVGHLESGDLRVAVLLGQCRSSLDRPAGLINAEHAGDLDNKNSPIHEPPGTDAQGGGSCPPDPGKGRSSGLPKGPQARAGH
jgi:hypothetical protein